MEFKGTKGQWIIAKIAKPNPNNDNCGAHSVHPCIDVWFSDVHSVKTKEEALSNAKLISKAPEMLEMLKYSLEALKVVTSFGATKPVIERIENLIKEATEI